MELLQKITWKEAQKEVMVTNPELVTLIDNMDPDDQHFLYKLECPWGQHILHEGVLCLPNENGEWVQINHPSISSAIADDLSYNITMPLGIVLKNSVELYIKALDRIIPFVFMTEGTIFGLWVSLHEDKSTTNHTGRVSNIIAGARSTLLLPKITDASSFRKLKKEFGLRSFQPLNLADQWPLLLELSKHEAFPQKWSTTVIYFSKKWLEPRKDIAWKLFKNYLLEQAWDKSGYLRNQVIFDLAFSCALEEKNLRTNPYLADTVKHLFSVCQNIYPAHEVAIDSSAIPLDAFQKIFVEVYGLKYRPTIMIPGYLNSDPLKSLYYSLEVPTLMSFYPKSRKILNKLEDLREIKHITQRIVEYLLEDRLRLKQAPLCRLINEANLGYYHTDNDSYQEIAKTYELEHLDNNLIMESKKYEDKDFCDTSPFLRGCVRISIKKHDDVG